MDRRTFIRSSALWAIAVTRATLAQSPRKIYRVGILGPFVGSDIVGPEPRSPFVSALLRGLRELGYVYGKDFVTEPRGDEGKPERLRRLAAELVSLPVDVIVARGIALPALKETTSTIPIVMAAAGDPVGQGLVRSLSRPGTNFTGLSLQSAETIGKRLALLKEIVPSGAPVAVLWNEGSLEYWKAAESAARDRGWKLLSLKIRDAGEIQGAFASAINARAGTLLVLGGGFFSPHTRQITDLADRSRLPAMYELRPYVEAGGLISYSADIFAIWRQAAGFVDKLLKGAKPGDLPIEQPTKFELVINMKTAKALGLTIPQSLLLRADEVIQ